MNIYGESEEQDFCSGVVGHVKNCLNNYNHHFSEQYLF